MVNPRPRGDFTVIEPVNPEPKCEKEIHPDDIPCRDYRQNGKLPQFTQADGFTYQLTTPFCFLKRKSVDFWLEDPTGVWRQPNSAAAPYQIYTQPFLPNPNLFALFLQLPAGTGYTPGSYYSLVISF
jgi:hypothetical protein